MNIPINRLKHCYMVGRVMQEAACLLHFPYEIEKEAFFIGYVHDSMKDFIEPHCSHGVEVSVYLSSNIAGIVRNHGQLVEGVTLESNPLQVLMWYGDMSVDANGRYCGMTDRLSDIYNRHGSSSPEYIDAIKLVTYLRKNGFGNIEETLMQKLRQEENEW